MCEVHTLCCALVCAIRMKRSLLLFIGFVAGFVSAALLLGRYQIALTQEHNSLGSETICYRLDKFTGRCDVNATSYKGLWVRLHEPPSDPYGLNPPGTADSFINAK